MMDFLLCDLGFFSSKLSKVNTKASLFALGTRGSLVENFQAPPMDIVPASTPPSQMPKHGYEELFRSLLRLLVDQATCEFMFVRDFFLADDDVTLGIFPHCSELLMVLLLAARQSNSIIGKHRRVHSE